MPGQEEYELQIKRDRKSATSESSSMKAINPYEMLHDVEEDQLHGVFGQNAVIWTLSRTREIGLNNGKPRKLARLIVVKNEKDKTTRKYLLKRLPYRDEKRRKRFLKEIEAHRHVCSYGGYDYISRFYGARDCISKLVNGRPKEGKLDYVMELGSMGDILSWVQGRWTSFGGISTREEQELFLRTHIASVQRIIAQVAFAVRQCFNAKIVHFDLKLENVVMSKILDDERDRYESNMSVDGMKFDWCVKLIDFGLARHFPDGNWVYREGRKGTPRYMAPEIAEGNQNIQNARNADIWPIGVMLWECLTGMPLWKEAVRNTKTYNEMRKERGFKKWFLKLCDMPQNKNFAQFVPADAVDMLDKVFARNPASRLTIDQMVKHKFLASQMPKYQSVRKELSKKKVHVIEIEEKKIMDSDELRNTALSGLILPNKFNLDDKENNLHLTNQEAGEVLPPRVKRREACVAKYLAVVYWFKTWSLYTLIIVAYIAAAPFWLVKSGFWDFHAYWSIFATGLPLILGLFIYHAWRGLNSSPKGQLSGKFSSTAWDVGMKPLVTELSQLSSFAVAVMWITNNSWTNIDPDQVNVRYKTELNGYGILGALIAYRVLSTLFFYLRAREMEIADFKKRPKIQIGLSQLVCLRIYWDVEKACQLRRQTTAIREHKILEGFLNAVIFLVVAMYYYFEKSIGTDGVKEASWLIFSAILSLISVALVLNMGDVLGISVTKSMWWRDLILIAFRMADVSLRVGAYAVFAACVSARYTIIVCAVGIITLCLLSYYNIIIINTNRFEFEKQPGAITKLVKTVLSSIYGMIACPLLHQAKYWYPVKILHDGFLIFASWWFQDENVELWDKAQTKYVVFAGTALFFILGIMSYFVIDWNQYEKIINVKGKDGIGGDGDLKKITEMCKEQPKLLTRFLVSGVLRVATVKAQAARGWEEYGNLRIWLLKNRFYDLIVNEEDPSVPTEEIKIERTRTFSRRKSEDEVKNMGPVDIAFNLEEVYGNVDYFSNDLSSYKPKAKALCMSVSPDGELLAVGLEDEPYLDVLKLPSMKPVTDLQRFGGKKRFFGAVTGVAFKMQTNGKLQLVAISEDARLRVFDVPPIPQDTYDAPLQKRSGYLKVNDEAKILGIEADLKKSTYKIRCLAMDNTTENFAVGVGNSIWFYSIQSGARDELRGHEDEVTSIKFFPNEPTMFVSGSKDRTVRIWDQSQREGDSFMSILSFGEEWSNAADIVRTVDIRANGTAIACGCINGFVFVWEKQSDKEWKVQARINANNWVNSVNFLPLADRDHRLILHTRPHSTAPKVEFDEKLRNGYSAIWDYKDPECVRTFVQRDMAVESSHIFQTKEGGLKLLTGSWTDKDKHTVVMWDLETGEDEYRYHDDGMV